METSVIGQFLCCTMSFGQNMEDLPAVYLWTLLHSLPGTYSKWTSPASTPIVFENKYEPPEKGCQKVGETDHVLFMGIRERVCGGVGSIPFWRNRKEMKSFPNPSNRDFSTLPGRYLSLFLEFWDNYESHLFLFLSVGYLFKHFTEI